MTDSTEKNKSPEGSMDGNAEERAKQGETRQSNDGERKRGADEALGPDASEHPGTTLRSEPGTEQDASRSASKEPAKKPKAPARKRWDGEPTAAQKPHILFCNKMKQKLHEENPGWTKGELHKEANRRWREASEETKAEFIAKAEADKARYALEYEAWWGCLSEEEKRRITAEAAAKAEKAERAKAEAKTKNAATPKTFVLKGGPAGLTKEQVIRFMQEFIPRHYLEGETLAWRELIEPMLRERYPMFQWEDNPDPAVDKSSLIRSLKSIWKEAGVARPLPASPDQMRLDEDEAAKASTLARYITRLIADIEAARKAELAEDVKEVHKKRTEAEERTLELEKFACETCLVWWCVATRKPSLYALGTDMTAFKFVSEMISRQFFPNGAPGRASTDWEAKERERKERQRHWKKSDSVIDQEDPRKLEPTLVKDADGSEKIVWVARRDDPVARVEENPEAIAKAREAAELALIKTYTVKIENHMKEFVRKFKSVDEEKLSREVLDKSGLPKYPADWQQPPAGTMTVPSEAAPER